MRGIEVFSSFGGRLKHQRCFHRPLCECAGQLFRVFTPAGFEGHAILRNVHQQPIAFLPHQFHRQIFRAYQRR